MRLHCLMPILLLSGLLVVLSCDKKQAKTPGLGEPAGHVVESTGKVTGQQPGAAIRHLKVDDVVFQDDTIVTGAASTLGILLTHNNARWELGSNSTRRVDESAAFGAKKQHVAILGGQEPLGTSAAGRNTTREAAASKATLPVQEDRNAVTKKRVSPAGKDKSGFGKRSQNKRPDRRREDKGERTQGLLGARARSAPESMPAPAPTAKALSKPSKDSEDSEESDREESEDKLASEQVTLIRSRARRCHKEHGGKGKITYQFDATNGLLAKGSHPSLDRLIACLRSAVPPTKNAPTVKSSIRFE